METDILTHLAAAMRKVGWNASIDEPRLYITTGNHGIIFDERWDDIQNAEAIILMLDEIQKRIPGCIHAFTPQSNGGWGFTVYSNGFEGEIYADATGPTRAACVAKDFIQVVGAEDAN